MDIAYTGSDLGGAIVIFVGIMVFFSIALVIDKAISAKKIRDDASLSAIASKHKLKQRGKAFVDYVRDQKDK